MRLTNDHHFNQNQERDATEFTSCRSTIDKDKYKGFDNSNFKGVSDYVKSPELIQKQTFHVTGLKIYKKKYIV